MRKLLSLIFLITLIACEETPWDHDHSHEHGIPDHTHEQFHHTHTEGGIYFNDEITNREAPEEVDISAEKHFQIKDAMRNLYEDVIAGKEQKYINKTFTFRATLIRLDREENRAVFWEPVNEEEDKALIFYVVFPAEMEAFFEGVPTVVHTVKTRINKTEILRGQGVVEVYITGILL